MFLPWLKLQKAELSTKTIRPLISDFTEFFTGFTKVFLPFNFIIYFLKNCCFADSFDFRNWEARWELKLLEVFITQWFIRHHETFDDFGPLTLYTYILGNALAEVQRVHKPADLWDITFCTRWFWGSEFFFIEQTAPADPNS